MSVLTAICILLLLLSSLLTFIIRFAAIRNNIVDVPNQRSSHDIPTPRGGGLAIVICWFMGVITMDYMGMIDRSLFFIFLTGIILAIAGMLDDIYSLKPWIRLLAQFSTACIAIYLLGGIKPVSIGPLSISSVFILYPAAVLGLVWFINLFNFLDGTDGYASLETITVAGFMFILTHDAVNLILISSVAGFLIWNWPKAKIFMGDIGSTQLGFILAVLGIYYHNTVQMSIIHWLMLSSLFWFDASLTLFRRWRNKEILSVAHRKHAYQRAVQWGISHRQLLFVSLSGNLVIGFFVLISEKYQSLIVPSFIVNMILLYLATYIIDRKVPFEINRK